ncbi:MAG: CysS/YqeB C-terminal domain-containing protein, partial [Steroidobacteraceae bacterium]
LLRRSPEEWLATRSTLVAGEESQEASSLEAADIDRMVAARIEARRRKDFTESDRIRDELTAAGIVLEDGPVGTTWRRK